MLKFLLLTLFSCSSTDWVSGPSYQGSHAALDNGIRKILKKYAGEFRFSSAHSSYESAYYPIGKGKRAKAWVLLKGDESPFALDARVFYEISQYGSNYQKGFTYKGELPEHAKSLIKEILAEADKIDSKKHGIDSFNVF